MLRKPLVGSEHVAQRAGYSREVETGPGTGRVVDEGWEVVDQLLYDFGLGREKRMRWPVLVVVWQVWEAVAGDEESAADCPAGGLGFGGWDRSWAK